MTAYNMCSVFSNHYCTVALYFPYTAASLGLIHTPLLLNTTSIDLSENKVLKLHDQEVNNSTTF